MSMYVSQLAEYISMSRRGTKCHTNNYTYNNNNNNYLF